MKKSKRVRVSPKEAKEKYLSGGEILISSPAMPRTIVYGRALSSRDELQGFGWGDHYTYEVEE